MVPLLPHLRVTEADIRAKVDELLSAGQDLLRNAAHGTSVHSGKDHVAVLYDLGDGLVIEGQDLLIVEAHQSGMLILDPAASGEAVGQMSNLGLGMVHHKAEQFTTGIAGGTTDGKTDHDTIPPFCYWPILLARDSIPAIYIGILKLF